MTKRDWERLASTFESEVFDIVSTDAKQVIGRVLREICRHRSDLVAVDLGCGIGTFAKRFSPRFQRVYGVDYSPRMLNRARSNCTAPNVTFLEGNLANGAARSVPRGDITVLFNVLTSPVAAVRSNILDTVWKVTKASGTALVLVPSSESAAHVFRYALPEDREQHYPCDGLYSRGGVVQKHFSRSEIAAATERAGFRCPRILRVPYPVGEEFVGRPCYALRRSPPWDWLAICTKSVRRAVVADSVKSIKS